MFAKLPLKKTWLFVAALCAAACVPQVAKISGRNPDLFEKESDHLQGRSRGTGDDPAPEVFIKEKQVKINDVDAPNNTGSLFNPDDERNYLYTPNGPLNVGRFIKVKVVANHGGEHRKGEPKRGEERSGEKRRGERPGEGGKDGKDKDKDKDKGGDDLEAELLKAVPDLVPRPDRESPELLRDFKMEIAHRYPNGDVLAILDRKSVVNDNVREVLVEARVPYDRLTSGEELTTDDLLDVHYKENHNGELAERNSSGWEDEYSLRLSGFHEAHSKLAMELEDDKKHLAEAAEKLETKIKAFGEERKQVAKQREDLGKQKANSDAKVQDLSEKVKEQQDTIEKQQGEIKDLQPEDKPGDAKEGGHG